MNLIINSIKSKNITEVQSTLDVGDFKHKNSPEKPQIKDNTIQRKLIIGCEQLYDKKTTNEDIYVDEKGIYHYVVPHCSHWESTNVTKHDTNWTSIYFENGKEVFVQVKKYRCKSCGKGSQVEFKDEFRLTNRY